MLGKARSQFPNFPEIAYFVMYCEQENCSAQTKNYNQTVPQQEHLDISDLDSLGPGSCVIRSTAKRVASSNTADQCVPLAEV